MMRSNAGFALVELQVAIALLVVGLLGLASATTVGMSTMGAMLPLADKIASMRIGDKQTVTSMDIGYFPKPSITKTVYEVERKPDENGMSVYRLKFTDSGTDIQGTLTVDAKHWPQNLVLDPPINMSVKRLR